MSSFHGLQTALSGIRAGQYGLETASNNVANAGTDGYTRQRVELSQRPTLDRGDARIGQGVGIDGVERMRDAFLDTRVRATGAEYHYQDTRAALLQRTEELFAEPDHGLSDALGGLWDSFEDLANDPDDLAARRQVLGALETVAARFNGIASGLAQLSADTETRLASEVTDANELLARVDELNREISSSGGNAVNDLLDERDIVLDELSDLIGVDVAVDPDTEHVEVSVGGTQLVSADGVEHVVGVDLDEGRLVAVDPDDADGEWDFSGEGETQLPEGLRGEIPALVGFLTNDEPGTESGLPYFESQLDEFATHLADTLNGQHEEGRTPDDNEGGELLTGTTAADIALADGLGPEDVAAGETSNPLDGRNAEALAGLRDAPMSSVDGGLPETSADDFYRDITVDLGRQTRSATNEADTREGLYTSAQSARSSAHDVSIDEEMVSLVQFQRALEASSRAMSAVDEALDVLINRTGVVGR